MTTSYDAARREQDEARSRGEPVSGADLLDPVAWLERRAYDEAVNAEAEERFAPAVGVRPKLTNLPETFWSSREVLTKIRQAAHSVGRSADAVFGACIARTSAMVHHNLKFDFGLGLGSLNLYVNLIGPSGVGKSKAADEAQRLLLLPSYLDTGTNGNFRDGIGLGTGEGIAEAYMGWATRDTGKVRASGPSAGEPKTEKVRDQVRHNVFFYVDEGEALTRTIERAGTTIGPWLRTAWTGSALGQSNAREETTRQVARGAYSLGLVIGYQYDTAQPLLSDVGPGTPQRFLWLSAIDPTIPDSPPEQPSPFYLRLCDGMGNPVTGVITRDQAIREEVWRRNLTRSRGGAEADCHDSHEILMLAKVASVLALYDGRLHVGAEDWALSQVVWATSAAMRDDLLAYGRDKLADEQERRVVAHVEREERAHLARASVPGKVERIGRWAAVKVHEVGAVPRSVLRKQAAGRDKPFFDAGVEFAASQGWVLVVEDGRLVVAGDARPA
jgi:hypothetical protein